VADPSVPQEAAANDVWATVRVPDATLIVTSDELIRRGANATDRWAFDALEGVVQDGLGHHLVLFRSLERPLVLDVELAADPEGARQAMTVLQLLLARHERRLRDKAHQSAPDG
jgi:hypothetical protein